MQPREERRRKRSANAKAYRAANPEKLRAREKAYRTSNREKISAYLKEYRAVNREKLRAGDKAYRAAVRGTNRERLREKDRSKYTKRRALKLGATVGDTKAITEWEKKWKRLKRATCHWCRQPFPPKKCHADHVIPLSKGGSHSLDNLVVACAGCNCSKNAKLPDVWNSQLAEPVLI